MQFKKIKMLEGLPVDHSTLNVKALQVLMGDQRILEKIKDHFVKDLVPKVEEEVLANQKTLK